MPADPAEAGAVIASYVPERDCKIAKFGLDLGANPGGTIGQGVEIIQTFLDAGPVLTEFSREGDKIVEWRMLIDAEHCRLQNAENGKIVKEKSCPRVKRLVPNNIPIVVRINAGSASTSEIVAGALQSNGVATVVGTPSFGKNHGQKFSPAPFGTGKRITVQRFAPGGKELDPAVIPDTEIPQSKAFLDDPFNNLDEQLVAVDRILGEGKEKALADANTPEAITAKAKRADEVRQEYAKRNALILEHLAAVAAGNLNTDHQEEGQMTHLSIFAIFHLSLLQFAFLYLETFAWTGVMTKITGYSVEYAEQTKILAAQQGVYNGCFAAGLLWSLFAPSCGHELAIAFTSCVVVVGLYGGFTAKRTILLVQALPGALALVAVLLS